MPDRAFEDLLNPLVDAIQSRRRVRLIYHRVEDEVTSIHEVAPVDVRYGDRRGTEQKVYLWAWCFAEHKAETHLLDRIEKVIPLDESFDAKSVLAGWPDNWPLPGEWTTPREW